MAKDLNPWRAQPSTLRPRSRSRSPSCKGMVSGVQRARPALRRLPGGAGIAPAAARRSPARASRRTSTWRCSGLLIERLDDECLGFLSRPVAARQPGARSRAPPISAPTLDAAMRRAARTFRLLQDDVRARSRCAAGRWPASRCASTDPSAVAPGLPARAAAARRSGACWRGWRAASCRRRASTSPSTARPMRAATARSSRRRCSSTSSRSAFWFDAALLQQPVRRDEAALRAFLADARANVIVPRRGDDAGQRARAQATCSTPSRTGPTSPPRPRRCTCRRRRCSDAWRAKARRSSR